MMIGYLSLSKDLVYGMQSVLKAVFAVPSSVWQ